MGSSKLLKATTQAAFCLETGSNFVQFDGGRTLRRPLQARQGGQTLDRWKRMTEGRDTRLPLCIFLFSELSSIKTGTTHLHLQAPTSPGSQSPPLSGQSSLPESNLCLLPSKHVTTPLASETISLFSENGAVQGLQSPS